MLVGHRSCHSAKMGSLGYTVALNCRTSVEQAKVAAEIKLRALRLMYSSLTSGMQKMSKYIRCNTK